MDYTCGPETATRYFCNFLKRSENRSNENSVWKLPKWVKPFETRLWPDSLSSAKREFWTDGNAIFYSARHPTRVVNEKIGKKPRIEMAFVIRNGRRKLFVFTNHEKIKHNYADACCLILSFKFHLVFKELEGIQFYEPDFWFMHSMKNILEKNYSISINDLHKNYVP